MSDSYLGQIKMFAGQFAPPKWAFANGNILPIDQNRELFDLIGTKFYGGDGVSTFALPDMRSRIPVSFGQGEYLRDWPMGSTFGEETVMLTTEQMPAHTHNLQASTAPTTINSPVGAILGNLSGQGGNPVFYKQPAPPYRQLADTAISTEGQGAPHGNMMRYQVLSFIILIDGIVPNQP